jgi:DNA polymerase-1
MVTAKVYGVTYDTVYDEQNKKVKPNWEDKRRITKAISFGVLYGEGPQKLAYTLGITVKKAQDFIDQYYEGFPSLKENIEKMKELVIKQGYLDNYFGFRRRWQFHSEEDHSTLREAVNFPVQSLAWNLIQLAMIQVDRELKKRKLKSRLVLQVYDSLVVEALNEEISEVAFIVKNAMENVNKPYDNINRVLLKSDIEVGLNLAELEKYEVCI